jgi:hypothetical protein
LIKTIYTLGKEDMIDPVMEKLRPVGRLAGQLLVSLRFLLLSGFGTPLLLEKLSTDYGKKILNSVSCILVV